MDYSLTVQTMQRIANRARRDLLHRRATGQRLAAQSRQRGMDTVAKAIERNLRAEAELILLLDEFLIAADADDIDMTLFLKLSTALDASERQRALSERTIRESLND